MNKEEILMRSREEKDEGMEYVENKGRKIGIVAFYCIFFFIALFNMYTNQSNYAILSMFWAFAAAEVYTKYQFTSRKSYLILTICGSIACIASLFSYVIITLR